MQSSKIELDAKRDRGIAAEWLGNLKGEARSDYEARLRNCKDVFDQLRAMIQKRYNLTVDRNVIDYDSPSWSHKQAHLNGVCEALQDIAQLLP